ncbi:type II toxin-antitoxin system ParD family antitoxin [Tautonia marina]|uniref:type II toxin-antitoxin system ParD family antitoxin n=1 Tax=Tautonia marina TaxID=2653855 RepID=UPI001260EBE3|nr:type II toxin-antitoxin system ParD family antitoxin [Tautonia marina]
MNVHITENSENIIRSKVQSGRYSSAEEVIERALRLLEEQDKASSPESGAPLTEDQKASLDAQRRLKEAGLLSEIRLPITDLTPYASRRAVPIQGEPLSETVIRERR